MASTKFIQLRVTKEQYERIRNKSQAKGHKTISSFMRAAALEKDLVFEKKFDEIHSLVKKQFGK